VSSSDVASEEDADPTGVLVADRSALVFAVGGVVS
jgi:hypothetical protein